MGRIIPVLAWSVLGDGMVAVLGGVLRGSGHQAMGALLNLCGYWLVGCPLAMLLGFKLRWDVVGFWCGLATATTLQVGGAGCGLWGAQKGIEASGSHGNAAACTRRESEVQQKGRYLPAGSQVRVVRCVEWGEGA